MVYFSGNETLEELKKKYRELSKKHHPDLGGNIEIMKQINNEYDLVFEIAKGKHNSNRENKHTKETPEQTREFISKIMFLNDIEIEICGSWVYLSGKTFLNKDALKELNCRWSKGKKVWYWFPGIEDSNAKFRGNKTLDEIRDKYGSEKMKAGSSNLLV